MSTQVVPDEQHAANQDQKVAEALRHGNVQVSSSGTRPVGQRIIAAHESHEARAVYLTWGQGTSSDFLFVHVTDIDGVPDAFIATFNTHADGTGYELTVAYEGGFPVWTEINAPQ